MKLEGSLDAFSLPDVFQLLMSTRKTGGLHLRRADAHGIVYFSGGSLCGASPDVRRQMLARRLVCAGAVSDEALGAAVDRAVAEPGTGVVRALADLDAVDADLLQGAAHEQIVDTLFDVLRWPDGEFSFTIKEANPDDVGLLLEADVAVSQARERLTHWESVAPYLPDAGTVLALASVVEADPVVSRDEWALLARVDGSRSVAAVIEATGTGEYAVVSKLAELVERGLLVSQGSVDDQGAGSATIAARNALLERLEGKPARLTAVAPVVDEPAVSLDEPPVVVAVDTQPVDEAATDETAADEDEPDDETATEDEPDEPDDEPDEDSASELTAADESAADLAASEPAPVAAKASRAATPDDTAPAADTAAKASTPKSAPARPVVPARPEPFTPDRQPDFPDAVRAASMSVVPNGTRLAAVGNALRKEELTPAHADPAALVERDPGVNKSLLLRLIAGVRGL